MSIEFLVTSLIVVVAPGTGVIYTLASGLTHGQRASVIAAIGCTFGIVPHLAAAVLGLAALLHTSAVAFQIAKFAGIAYLLYMAWGALRETGGLEVDQRFGIRSAWSIGIKGFLINILNPKLSIFFLAFLPQFVTGPADGAVPQMLEMGAIFMVMTLLVFVIYGLFAAWMRNHIISRPAVMTWARRAFAGAFLGLGAKLALAEN